MYRDRGWAGYEDVTVMHPHGIIPYDLAKPKSDQIVLDQASYSEVVGKETKVWWQRLVLLMSTHTCLFVGISGLDKNLDSILTSTRDRHICAEQNTPFWGVTLRKGSDPVGEVRWKARGIFSKEVADWGDLPDFLFKICQEAAKSKHV